MKIVNRMELIVEEELERLLGGVPDACKCQKCRCDIMVWALNRLPPRYVLTDKGRMYTRLTEQEVQFRADVARELTKAIIRISKNPKH